MVGSVLEAVVRDGEQPTLVIHGWSTAPLDGLLADFGLDSTTVRIVAQPTPVWFRLWTRYAKRAPHRPARLKRWALATALVLAVAMSSRSGSIPKSATTLEFVLALFTGVATIVPLLLFAYAAQRVPLTIIGPMQYIVPTINLVLGVAVYGESMPAWRIVGFAVAWLALLLVSLDGLRGARAAGLAEPAPVPLEG